MGEAHPEQIRRFSRRTVRRGLGALQLSELRLPEDVAEALPGEIRRSEVVFWIAVNPDDERIMGTIGVTWPAPRSIELRRLFEADGIISPGANIPNIGHVAVATPFRNRGIASRLIQTAHQEAKLRRYERIYLTVGMGNDDAQRLYKRLSYEATGFMVQTIFDNEAPDLARENPDNYSEVLVNRL